MCFSCFFLSLSHAHPRVELTPKLLIRADDALSRMNFSLLISRDAAYIAVSYLMQCAAGNISATGKLYWWRNGTYFFR